MADKYYRLVCFVVDICADVLRRYFVKLAKTDAGNTYTSVDAYLSHRKRDVMQLFNNKKLRRDQYDLLYPINGTADENQWDVSILVTLITELFATRLKPRDIFELKTEIRGIRNELQHNPNTGNISDDDFDDYWGRLDDSVRLIAKNALDPNDQTSLLEKINQVKCNHLPNLGDCLRIWHEETSKQLLYSMNEVKANAKETTSILRQVTVQKPGPSGCRRRGQYAQSSSLPVTRNNLGALTECFLKAYKISSGQVDDEIYKKAKKSFQVNKAIVLTGREKCGKTSIAVALASAYEEQQCLLLKKPHDIDKIDFPNICLVIIDEFAGKYRYEENDVYEWYNMFDHLYNTVIAGQMNVIITCEKDKLEKCIKQIGRHAILDHVVDVTLQTAVVKLEVIEQYGHVSGQKVTTDHYVGTISNTTQTLNYTSSLLADPSQGPIPLSRHDTIPISTGNTSILGRAQMEGLGIGHVSGHLVNTDSSIGTISNTTQSKDYTTPLSVVPSQGPILQLSHDRISTGNTSFLGRAHVEGIQNPMQWKRGFFGMESVIKTEIDDLSVKRSSLLSSGLWSVEEEREMNIRINDDSLQCYITGICTLPSGEILLADYNNKKLKKLDNMYNVKCVCDLPDKPYDVCYVRDNIAVLSLYWSTLQFVDTKRSMTLIRSIDIDHSCRGLACHGDQLYVSNINGSVYSYSTDGIKQQHIYSSRNNLSFHYYSITVSNDGSKLYLPGKNELVTIDNNGNHLFTLNNEDIDSSCGVCVDDQSFIYVNDMNGNIIQISKDGKTILQAITNLSHMTCARSCTLTFDRKNKALIAAGRSDTIRPFKLRKQWETQTR